MHGNVIVTNYSRLPSPRGKPFASHHRPLKKPGLHREEYGRHPLQYRKLLVIDRRAFV
jgi:hypothetical protein